MTQDKKKQFEKELIQYGLKNNYIEKEKDGTLKFVGSKNQKNKSVKPKNNNDNTKSIDISKSVNEIQCIYEKVIGEIKNKKEKEIIHCLFQDLSDKLLDNVEENKNG